MLMQIEDVFLNIKIHINTDKIAKIEPVGDNFIVCLDSWVPITVSKKTMETIVGGVNAQLQSMQETRV